jgi:hypothetical protein
MAGAYQLLDGAFGVGAFGDVLDIGGLDLFAERFLKGLTAEVVLVSPAEIADRTEIDEADLELFGSMNLPEGCAREPKDRGDSEDVPFLHDLTPGCASEIDPECVALRIEQDRLVPPVIGRKGRFQKRRALFDRYGG